MNEKETYELLKAYKNKGKWRKALECAKALVDYNPKHPDYYKELSTCYRRLKRPRKATESMKKYLEIILNENINDIIAIIKKAINVDTSLVKSTYKCVEFGGNNLGFIEHIDISNDQKYFTKIVQSKKLSNERLFYDNIREKFSELKIFSPELIHFQEIEGPQVCFLTLEKIQGDYPNFYEHFEDVYNVNKAINGIQYNQIKDIFPSDVEIDFSSKPLTLSKIFTMLHKRETNVKVFEWLYYQARERNYSLESVSLIQRLEKLIIGNGFYKELEPKVNYTFIHGDFQSTNIIYDSNEKNYKVIDWAYCGYGVKGVDLVKYFRREGLNFKEIKQYFLLKSEITNYLKPIEQVFMVYSLIITWFNFMNKKLNENHSDYLLPAINYIEEVVNHVKRKTV
ncbi:phosphotransferase [Alkalihalobacterium bogoriense]|uniref:phosphotransferase n=1 Tax=Alkalihalobacterium bogoriense TaxID=246272 RepID=UPI00047B8F05|nr:phosphotransferase [Alkalihalobacterium bogoriense]